MLSSSYEVYGSTQSGVADIPTKLFRLDGTKESEIKRLLETIKPNIVINCAGLTVVDECEARPEAAWLLNSTLPGILSNCCIAAGVKFVHISTDHFESEVESSRREDSSYFAVNQYGYSKLQAEKMILAGNSSAIVVRTNFFGHSSSPKMSLLSWIVEKLESRQQMIGLGDVVFSPVSLTILSRTLDDLIKKDYSGLIHVASNEQVSKYEFACLVASKMNFPKSLINEGSMSDLRLKANRPNRLALNNQKLLEVLGCDMPTLEDMLSMELGKFPSVSKLFSSEG
jgi:dTDP-4-dehydrorhamnose reductase